MLQWRALFLLALLAPSFGSPVPKRASPSHKAIRHKYRLPTNIVPVSYAIELKPGYDGGRILDIKNFTGTVNIIAKVEEDTSEIVLHRGKHLDIHSNEDEQEGVQVFAINNEGNEEDAEGNDVGTEDNAVEGNGNEVDAESNKGRNETPLIIKDFKYDDLTEKWTIQLDDGLTNGTTIRMIIKYTGIFVENSLEGFYYSTFKTQENKEPAALLSTQFQPTSARLAFPCFDEPWMKATFELSIWVTYFVDAITNTKKIIDEGSGEETDEETSEETDEETSKETSEETHEETSEETDEETSVVTDEETSVVTDEETSEETDEETSEETDEETNEETDEETSEETDEETSEETDEYLVRFEKTPEMSTYLLAFVVYEKNGYEKLAENFFIEEYGRTDSKGQEKFSNNFAIYIVLIFEEFTRIGYYKGMDWDVNMEMRKLTQAAIPDFQAGAMENWGLVTYRENALFYDETAHSCSALKAVSQIIAHEIAHQWFGNWVTTNWWNTIWLNEGFANLMEYYAMEKMYKTWKMPERMVLDEQMSAFDADSSVSSTALTYNVNTPTEIINHFGTITYSKGGSILRQIRNVLGEDAFQEAIHDYLVTKKLSTVEPKDLFLSFISKNDKNRTKIEDDDLEKVLINWTEDPGYPVITVEKINSSQIRIKQERFLFHGEKENTESKYYVYLTWFTDKSQNIPQTVQPPQEWLMYDDAEKIVSIDESEEDWSWIIVNPHQAGYYRVDYSSDLWDNLANVLQDPETRQNISALDRAALINNALNLARSSGSSNMDYGRAFKLMTFLRDDFEFEPWAAARNSLAHLGQLLITSQEYKDFVKYIVENAYNEVEFNDTSSIPEDLEDIDNVEITNRVNILTLACAAGYSDCLSEAEKRLKAFLDATNTDVTEVPPNLQSVVYCYGLKGTNVSELWDELWGQYTIYMQKDATRRLLIASALGCVNDASRLNQYLEYSLNIIPYNERYLAFSYVTANPEIGADTALEFLKSTENVFSQLKESYGESRLKRVIIELGSRLTTETQRDKLELILEENSLKTEYKDALVAANANLNWLKTYGEAVKRGMRGVNGAPTVTLVSTLAALCAAILTFLR